MPITPKEAATWEGKTNLLSSRLVVIERMIDQQIKSSFDGVNPVRFTLIDGQLDPWLAKSISGHYGVCGWDVKFDGYDDQRDGSSYWILFTPLP